MQGVNALPACLIIIITLTALDITVKSFLPMTARFIAVYNDSITRTYLMDGHKLQTTIANVHAKLQPFQKAQPDTPVEELHTDRFFLVEIYKSRDVANTGSDTLITKGTPVYVSNYFVSPAHTVRFSDLRKDMSDDDAYRFVTSFQNKMPQCDLKGNALPKLSNKDFYRILDGNADFELYYDFLCRPVDIRFYDRLNDPDDGLDCISHLPALNPTAWLRGYANGSINRPDLYDVFIYNPIPAMQQIGHTYKPVHFAEMSFGERLEYLRFNEPFFLPPFQAVNIIESLTVDNPNTKQRNLRNILKINISTYTDTQQLLSSLRIIIGDSYEEYIGSERFDPVSHRHFLNYLNDEEAAEINDYFDNEVLMKHQDDSLFELFIMTKAMGQPVPTLAQFKDLLINKLPLTAIAEKADNNQ